MLQHCCATKFYNKNVSVSDSIIFLTYNYDDSLCSLVDCITGWSRTTFASKPIAAGTYSIYEGGSYYCKPNAICLDGVTAPVYLGKITVNTPTAVIPADGKVIFHQSPELAVTGSIASVMLAKSSRINLRVFTMNGALVANLVDAERSAGKYGFDLINLLPVAAVRGTLVVQLSVDGIVKGARAVVLTR